MNKEEPFYDVLINLKTPVNNKLFIHPIRYCLCQIKPDDLVDNIDSINNQSLEGEQLLRMLKKVPKEGSQKNS